MRRCAEVKVLGRGLGLVLGLFLACGAARANPISMEIVRGRQVPKTHHVQLTFGVDGHTPTTPLSVTRDGKSLSLSWKAASGSFSANTGSGLRPVNATQACDCDVAVGSHKYVIKINTAMGGSTLDLPANVDVVQSLTAPPDAGPVGDVMPWSIPEPSQIQGLDCVTACSGAPADDAGAQPREKDEDGCGVGGGGDGAVAPWLAAALLLGLGLLLRRR